MNRAIDDAYRKGDHEQVDVLLTIKLARAREDAAPVQEAHHGG